MKPSKRAQKLLERMGLIEQMERGKLCRMAGRAYYNLQVWRNGRNEIRYVRQEERAAVQKAIDGYRLFTKLAADYADEIIKQTRREHQKQFPNKPKTQKTMKKAP